MTGTPEPDVMPPVAPDPGRPPTEPAPSAELLPADGVGAPVQAPVASEALATEALATKARRLLARFEPGAPLPPGWSSPGFVREVGLVRGHLCLIRSRAALAASYGREAFHAVLEPAALPGPVRVAYAIRWLELADGRTRPAWPTDPTLGSSLACGRSAATRTARVPVSA